MIAQYSATGMPRQIDLPPAREPAPASDGKPSDPGFQRTGLGALHLIPGGTLELTADEAAFIQKEHSDVFRLFTVLVPDAIASAEVKQSVLPAVPDLGAPATAEDFQPPLKPRDS